MHASHRISRHAATPDDQLRLDGIHIFFGAPSDQNHQAELEALRAAATLTEARFGVSIDVCSGADCPSDVCPAKWVRSTLESNVDGLVEVHGRSWGCGREDAMGAERRLVRAVLVHHEETPSRMLAHDGAGRMSRLGFDSLEQLRWALTDWLEAFLPDLRSAADRRRRRGVRSRPLRIANLKRWELLDAGQRQDVALALGMACLELSRVLQSDDAFANLDVDDAIWLEEKLSLLESENSGVRLQALERLDRRELFAFQQARQLKNWTDDLAAQVLDRGLEMRDQGDALTTGAGASGERWKLRLTSYKAWLRVYEDLCDANGN